MKQFTKTGLDILRARALIDTPKKWCKGSMRLIVNGKSRYCMLGAVGAVQEIRNEDRSDIIHHVVGLPS